NCRYSESPSCSQQGRTTAVTARTTWSAGWGNCPDQLLRQDLQRWRLLPVGSRSSVSASPCCESYGVPGVVKRKTLATKGTKGTKSTKDKPPKVSLCFLCLLWLIFLPTGGKTEVVIEFHSIEDAVDDGNFDFRVISDHCS